MLLPASLIAETTRVFDGHGEAKDVDILQAAQGPIGAVLFFEDDEGLASELLGLAHAYLDDLAKGREHHVQV